MLLEEVSLEGVTAGKGARKSADEEEKERACGPIRSRRWRQTPIYRKHYALERQSISANRMQDVRALFSPTPRCYPVAQGSAKCSSTRARISIRNGVYCIYRQFGLILGNVKVKYSLQFLPPCKIVFLSQFQRLHVGEEKRKATRRSGTVREMHELGAYYMGRCSE